ncbi:MAG TPA: response regulator [Bacillota bacterium]
MNKILAIDDNEDILYTLQAIGETAKFNIVTVNDGFKALDLLKKSKFDLIMVDYYMPNINGLTLVKKIREISKSIPILVLTVDESINLAQKFLDCGATDFAVKPIRTADLISRVKLHLKLSQNKRGDQFQDLEIPKGLSFPTLKLIMDYLHTINEPETIELISQKTGLAYQTVHRYLEYLVKKKQVKVKINYGKIGRPIHKYYL